MARKPLKIAYLCDQSPLDRNLYSGGNARIYDALQSHVGEVTILSQSWHWAEPLRRLIMATPDRVNVRARWRAHLALAGVIARRVEAELRRGSYDVLFGAYSLQSLYRVRAPEGVVTTFTSDATQTVYRNSEIAAAHPDMSRLARRLDAWIERCEGDALRACDLLLWPSDWVKDAAQARYELAPESSFLVPWGANIDPPAPPAAREIGPGKPVHLLLVGRNWFAKGGPLAFDTMQVLRARGIDARLTVIGCQPPPEHQNAYVTVHPQLNKAVPVERDTFNAAFAQAHVLLQPSYESYGFVFCEASAHGLPSLCLRVGGVPVRDGVNGFALAEGADAASFAELIQSQIDQPAGYAQLCQSSCSEYDTRLNWDAWGQQVAQLLDAAVARKRG